MMFTVTVDMFFDRALIESAAKSANEKAIKHGAGYVAKTTRRSMKTRTDPDKASEPGKPPHAHLGWYKKSIKYGYDRALEIAVIGALARGGRSKVPALLEFGGTQTVKVHADPKAIHVGFTGRIGRKTFLVRTVAEAKALVKFYNRKTSGRGNKNTASKRANYYFSESPKTVGGTLKYEARPHMKPGLDKSIHGLMDLYPQTFNAAWAASIK